MFAHALESTVPAGKEASSQSPSCVNLSPPTHRNTRGWEPRNSVLEYLLSYVICTEDQLQALERGPVHVIHHLHAFITQYKPIATSPCASHWGVSASGAGTGCGPVRPSRGRWPSRRSGLATPRTPGSARRCYPRRGTVWPGDAGGYLHAGGRACLRPDVHGGSRRRDHLERHARYLYGAPQRNAGNVRCVGHAHRLETVVGNTGAPPSVRGTTLRLYRGADHVLGTSLGTTVPIGVGMLGSTPTSVSCTSCSNCFLLLA